MIELNNKYNESVKIFNDFVEEAALSQIIELSNSPLAKNAHIRITPDVHAGKGCTIGTTMLIDDKVCPNLVGVDIGCGILMAKTNINWEERWEEADKIIKQFVPHGKNVHSCEQYGYEELVNNLRCKDKLDENTISRALKSGGTLGGGNHYIEFYKDGWIGVHTGSRNLGVQVARYYQKIAENEKLFTKEELNKIEPHLREQFIQQRVEECKVPKALSFLINKDLNDYLYDVSICCKFAKKNREDVINTIVKKMNGIIFESFDTVHNYIDKDEKILRKGAVSAKEGEKLAIALNMRDGILICTGQGNKDWNYSAPHGAGRLYSRSEAKEKFTVEEFEEEMKGIFSTTVNASTLDEAPFAYKDFKEIMKYIEPTVKIEKRLIPVYNFKASE